MHRTFALLAACCLTLAGTSLAQNPIPNAGFENWSADEPVDWLTSNGFGPVPSVIQSSDAHSGNSAVVGLVTEPFPGIFSPPAIWTGDQQQGFAVSQNYGQVRGYYKFNSFGGDQLVIQAFFRRGSDPVATGLFTDSTDVATYTEFQMDMFIIDSTLVPDTGFITATIFGGPLGDLSPGSQFWLDDLSLTEQTGGGCPVTLTGDVDGNGNVVTSDIIYLVNAILKLQAPPVPCPAAGDVNCDGNLGTSDIIYLVNTVLKAQAPPCDVCTLIPGTWSCP